MAVARTVTPYSSAEHFARSQSEFFNETISSTVVTITLDVASKFLRLHNSGSGAIVYSLGGETPTATTNGMRLPAGATQDVEFTTNQIKAIRETGVDGQLWVMALS